MAVVAAVELHDEVAPGGAPGERGCALIAASVPEETSRIISTEGTAREISSAISTSPAVGAP